MKKFYLLLMIFSMVTSYFAQQTYALKDNSNEIFGYAELSGINSKKDYFMNTFGQYQIRAKEVKLVLQDINLNKINDVLLKFDVVIQDFKIAYNKNSVLIAGISEEKGICSKCTRYFIYDLKTNKLSNLLNTPSGVFGDDAVINAFMPIDNVGYLFIGVNKKKFNTYSSYAIDDSGKELYKNNLNYNNSGKPNSFFIHKVFNEENMLIMLHVDDRDLDKTRYQVLILDANTGKEINNILLDDEKYRYEPKTISLKNDKIYIFGDVYKAGKKFEGGLLGFFMTTTDKKGIILEKKIAPISDLKMKFDIDKDGEVKKKGFIYSHEFVIDESSKNVVMAGEYLKGKKVGNLIFLEFDENFKFKNSHEIEKVQNTAELPFSGTARTLGLAIKTFGYFDYIFSDKLDKNKGLSFFYKNTTEETIIGPFERSKHNIGTVAYQNGKFTNNIISFSSKNPTSILPNKPGYFLLFESNKNTETEKRIEKINY